MTLKIEAGKKYRTRGGNEAEVLKTDLRNEQPIVGIVTHDDGSQCVYEWTVDGYYWPDDPRSDLDLISEIKPKRVVWLNVYDDDRPTVHSYHSREEADSYAYANRLACIRLEFEEGQFDV
jgi:hypothetical protein